MNILFCVYFCLQMRCLCCQRRFKFNYISSSVEFSTMYLDSQSLILQSLPLFLAQKLPILSFSSPSPSLCSVTHFYFLPFFFLSVHYFLFDALYTFPLLLILYFFLVAKVLYYTNYPSVCEKWYRKNVNISTAVQDIPLKLLVKIVFM